MCDIDVLNDWYNQYIVAVKVASFCAPLVNVTLDLDRIENEVNHLAKDVHIIDGFCSVCRKVFDRWPFGLRLPDDIQDEQAVQPDRPVQMGTHGTFKPSKATAVEPLSHFDQYPAWDWDEDWGDSITLETRPTTISLEAAVRAGCRCCGLLLQSIVAADLLHVFRAIEHRLGILNKPSRVSLVVVKWSDAQPAYILSCTYPGRKVIDFDVEDDQLPPHSLKLNIHRLNTPSAGSSPSTARISATETCNTGFPLTLDTVLVQANQWASECLSSHSACNKSVSIGYPSRLLSIAQRPIKLVTTKYWASKPDYATLSYCWGGSRRHVCLTDDNMDAFTSGVPDKLLPRTFQDAITVALAVGLEYLWIDSLCIIQDNTHDWETEAGRMASVYGGSSLTIAASSAKSAEQGFLNELLPGCNSFRVDLNTGSGTETCEFKHSAAYAKFVTQSHLSSRAWAVQEKVLSPRMLHCGSLGFFWECRTCIASDCLPNGFANHLIPPPLVWRAPDQEEAYYESYRERWADIRDWYSGCNLTFPSDKLIAFSGIARQIQEQSGDEYLAGLWRKCMPADLCWAVEQPHERPAYREPSWSWASVDGKVATRYTKVCETVYAQVHSVDIKNRADQFGAVDAGALFLRCRGLVAGQIVEKSTARRSRPHTSWIRGGEYEMYVDVGHEKHDFAFDPDAHGGNGEIKQGDDVYLLALHGGEEGASSTLRDGTIIQHKSVVGLVLKYHDLGGEFTRVGYFRFPYNVEAWLSDNLVDDYHPFLQKLAGSAELTEELASQVVTGVGDDENCYLIKII